MEYKRNSVSSLAATLVTIGALAGAANAATLTTEYITNTSDGNGGANGGAVYFNLTVGASDITVTGISSAFNYGDAFVATDFDEFEVWTLEGSSAFGNEGNGGLWTQVVSSGSGTTAPLTGPTVVTLSNSFNLNAGTLYGIALVSDNDATSFAYTSPTTTPAASNNFSDANINLDMGTASQVPFSGGVFGNNTNNPRTFNGSVTYDVVPEPTSAMLLGLGAVGFMARRRRS